MIKPNENTCLIIKFNYEFVRLGQSKNMIDNYDNLIFLLWWDLNSK